MQNVPEIGFRSGKLNSFRVYDDCHHIVHFCVCITNHIGFRASSSFFCAIITRVGFFSQLGSLRLSLLFKGYFSESPPLTTYWTRYVCIPRLFNEFTDWLLRVYMYVSCVLCIQIHTAEPNMLKINQNILFALRWFQWAIVVAFGTISHISIFYFNFYFLVIAFLLSQCRG